MIDWTQPVETTEDPPRPVRVLCTDAGEQYPIVALISREPIMFTKDGHEWPDGSGITLRNVAPKPVRYEGYLLLGHDGVMVGPFRGTHPADRNGSFIVHRFEWPAVMPVEDAPLRPPENTMSFNINDLTIGQAKELANMFGAQQAVSPVRVSPMIGRHCVVRTYSAGVHIGTIVSHDGDEVLLKDARRLWKWEGAFTLSEVATAGVKKQGSRIAVAVPEIFLTNVNEIIPTSEVARKTFEACHEKA